MAKRNFFGKLRDSAANRVSPGNVYDARGNYLNNGGRAAAATALKIGANMLFPGAGMVVDRIMSPWVNRGANYGIGEVQREGVPIYGAPSSAQYAYTAAPSSASNLGLGLGLGAQTPGNSWQGYMQGTGSANNFGNQQFGNGMASQPGSWAPQSQWGQQVTQGQPAAGSYQGFGNNVGGFLGGGRTNAGQTGGTAGLTRSGGAAAGWRTGDVGSAYAAFSSPFNGDWTGKYERAI